MAGVAKSSACAVINTSPQNLCVLSSQLYSMYIHVHTTLQALGETFTVFRLAMDSKWEALAGTRDPTSQLPPSAPRQLRQQVNGSVGSD